MVVGAVLLTVLGLPLLVLGYSTWVAGAGYLNSEALVAALVVILIVTVLVGFVFLRALTGPVTELTERTARLTAGDRSATAPLARYGNREVADLSAGLFGMADALFARTDYISNFARHVSHEVKSPVTSIRGAAELLLDQSADMTGEERQRFLENILADTHRIAALLDRLQDLAMADHGLERGETDLAEVIAELTGRFSELTVVSDVPAGVSVGLTAESASIVFGNLLENAQQNDAAKVTIRATSAERMVQIDVADDGRGVSKGNEDRIFDLFFTTRRETGGTGMGLGIVRSVLIASGGGIELMPDHRGEDAFGATFRILVPAA